jgi:hypothetical protein
MEGCEFCSAEVEMYDRFPQSEELMPIREMPVPLFELASALLGNKNEGSRLLNNMLRESETLHLKEA